jgi:hypothetical protein
MTKRANKPEGPARGADPAHAPGKAKRGAPPAVATPPQAEHDPGQHDQPWVPTSGLVGRSRRSPHQ